ncbi:MAG: pumilio domain member 6 [Sclerophora amabilis]|nr:MAG: pumilio domain member 6 [Sclerophora amabilis]
MAPQKRKSSPERLERRQNESRLKKLKPDASGGRVKAASQSDDLDHPSTDGSDGFEGFDEEDIAAPVNGDGSQAHEAPKSSSRESHAKQKALTQDRKAAKPNADLIQRSKKIWERLRLKSHVPLDERKKLVAELFEIVTGRVRDFVLKHDSVRVIQTAIKYANLEQRKMIGRELKGEYKNLAESRYAKFLIGKLLVHGDADLRDAIVPEFYGHVRRLIKHPEASWILDDIYRSVATPYQKTMLLREWYGPDFALFKAVDQKHLTSNLSDLLAEGPEKRSPIMRSLHELINQLIQKKMTGFTMLHDAMLEYFKNVKPGSEEMMDFLELLKGDEEGDLLKNLAFTKSGARVDRKHILRQYKDTISMLAYDNHGYLVIIAAYEIIDDTVLTFKSIFPELIGKSEGTQPANIVVACTDLNVRIPLLYIPAGRAKWLLNAETISFLEEIDAIRKESSKKDPAVRKQELLEKMSPPLLKTIENEAKELCQSSFGWQYIAEVLLDCVGPKARANEAVAEAVSGDPSTEEHVASMSIAGKTLRTLVLGGKYDVKLGQVNLVQPRLDFHNTLFASIKPHIVTWATGPSSFVVLDMLDADGFLYRDELLNLLRKHRKFLKSAAAAAGKGEAEGGGGRGVEIDGAKAKLKKKAPSAASVGNKGAMMILQKLV